MIALHSEHVLAVPDLATATAWWCGVMGFQVTFETPGWAFLRLGGCRLRLGECPEALSPADLGDHRYFAFVHVDDIDAAYVRLRSAGADVLKPPTDEPWGLRELGVQTPDGHRFMLGQAL